MSGIFIFGKRTIWKSKLWVWLIFKGKQHVHVIIFVFWMGYCVKDSHQMQNVWIKYLNPFYLRAFVRYSFLFSGFLLEAMVVYFKHRELPDINGKRCTFDRMIEVLTSSCRRHMLPRSGQMSQLQFLGKNEGNEMMLIKKNYLKCLWKRKWFIFYIFWVTYFYRTIEI